MSQMWYMYNKAPVYVRAHVMDEAKEMTTVTTKEARDQLSDLVNRAAYGKERIVLTRRGKGVAALIGLDDLLALEQMMRRLEDQADLEAAEKALGDAKREGTVPWEQVKKELGL